MKKWIKAHSKILIILLETFFIAVAIYGLVIDTEDWKIIVHLFSLTLWILILLFYTGVFTKIYEWWNRD